MATQRSLYDVLNVSPDAEPVVLEAAYRALMKKYHPDQAGLAAEAGGSTPAAINEAFAVLRDPERRADYDRREGARHQALHLASYPAIPPPPPRAMFGWGGWALALLLGAVLAIMAQQRQGGVVPATAEAQPAPRAASRESASQPRPEAPPPAFLEAGAPERDVQALQRNAAAMSAMPALRGRTIGAFELSRAAATAKVRARPRYRGHRIRARAKPLSPEEKEFLEREGYIY